METKKINDKKPQNSKTNSNSLFIVQKIYMRHATFEAPNVPAIFEQKGSAKIELGIDIVTNKLTADNYEVILKLKVTNKSEDKVIFLIELAQAGIFTIKGVKDEQIKAFTEIMGPQILFPYASEAISSLTGRGGFTSLHLTPMNFERVYRQKEEQMQKSKKESDLIKKK